MNQQTSVLHAEESTPSVRQLSHMQRLIWTGQQLDPQSPLYNAAFRIRIPMAIDAAVFEAAFRAIVVRSESLRTTVVMSEQGEPQVRLIESPQFDFQNIDLSDSADPFAEACQWCQSQCEKMLPMEHLMFDSALLKLADEDYVWFINQHHLICDAWGVTQLHRIQVEFYEALVAGRPLPDLDEIDWLFLPDENKKSAGDTTSGTKSLAAPAKFYGQTHQRGSSSSTRVSVGGDQAGASSIQELLATITSDKRARSFSKDLGLFNVVLTLLYSFLARVGDENTICIGVPFHNRMTKPEKESMGPFISFYPIEVCVEDDDTFVSLLKKVQTATNRYLQNATSGKGGNQSNAAFNVVCNFIHASFVPFESAEVDPVWLHPNSHDAEHHLRLHAGDFGGSGNIELNFDFNDSVFAATQQSNAVVHFRKLIEAMAQDMEAEIAAVDILSGDEACLLSNASVSSNPPSSAYGDVIERFEASCQQHADCTAITDSLTGESLTYAQLLQRVDQTVGTIKSKVKQTDTRIAVCLPRSVDAVVAMLAILKSGHAFVPVDPTWPEKRKQFLLSDGRVGWQFAPELQLVAEDVPSSPAAYVLYTSGSTGQPKGVEIGRDAMAAYIGWAADYYCGQEQLSFPLFTALTFDLTMTSVFVPLVSGGQIVVYPPRSEGTDLALLDVVKDNLVDIIKLTPSHLSLLANRELNDSRVKQMIFGGEDLKADLVHRIAATFPNDVLIHNEYGPTEATVGCIVHSIKASSKCDSVSVPIGHPIGNMRALILNKQMQRVPVGVEGDLYIAGDQLAKGYFGNEELTADRFIDHPLVSIGKLYKTGDVARLNHEGIFEYFGRRDQQVKIRGARIEMGAIESALQNHPQISESVVTTFGKNATDQALEFCRTCGLASNFPGTTFNENMVCNQCTSLESYRDQAQAYFKPLDELEEIFQQRAHNSAPESQYDCISLLSGGKDSTYMLGRLADMGLKVLAFTLDNGYISEEAKANIRRVVATLGVDHVFGSTPAMNEIFVDSLKRHSNVCQGCFKTIYTLAMNLAKEKSIPFIITGLSRGQFFETRLTEDLFNQPCSDLVQIDQTVLDARRAYHQIDDAVHRNLDVADLQGERIFKEVRILDFYRYCDVNLDEMYEYLDRRLPWVRPSDTGRSTNCLINDVGIYVHKRRAGYHNYALPYAWDVRMGHKQREAALEELDDDIDVENVHRILAEIGYDGDLGDSADDTRLVAYYVAEEELPVEELTQYVGEHLPAFMLPSRFVRLDSIPLSENGKVDRSALPDPNQRQTMAVANQFVAPQNDTEEKLAEIWAAVLGVEKVGVRDNFFELGGDSILAIQIVARAQRAGIKITPLQFFESLTVEKLAVRWEHDVREAQVSFVPSDITPLVSPIQNWALEHGISDNQFWNQAIEVSLPFNDANGANIEILKKSLAFVCNHHTALRTSVTRQGIQTVEEIDWESIPLEVAKCQSKSDEALEAQNRANQLVRHGASQQLAAVLFDANAESNCSLWITINHMAVDAVSFQTLIDDLAIVWESLEQCKTPRLNDAPEYLNWSHLLNNAVNDGRFSEQLKFWQEVMSSAPPSITPAVDGAKDSVRIEHQAKWSAGETEKLNQVVGNRISVDELLMVALIRAVAVEDDSFRFFVERHGRAQFDPNLDFSQTVGWFTALSPVAFEQDSLKLALPKLIERTKDRLRATDDQGIGYGALLTYAERSVRGDLAGAFGREVVFNYLGKKTANSTQQPFSPLGLLELHRSPSVGSFAALEVNLFLGQQLELQLNVDSRVWSASETSRFAIQFFECLSAAVKYLADEGKDEVAASDFPLASLGASGLKDLAAVLGKSNADKGER